MKLLEQVRKELKLRVDKRYKEFNEKIIKGNVVTYGVRYPSIRGVASKFYPELKGMSKKQLFGICEVFMKTPFHEELVIGIEWASRRKSEFTPGDLVTFKRWLDQYCKNWAAVDDFCGRLLGEFLIMYPEKIPELKEWARDKNMWVRRASVVGLIKPVKKLPIWRQVLQTSDRLIKDREDLIHKAVGWTLRETDKVYHQEVILYLKSRKHKLPRTTLRYAIERYPERLRQQLMKK